MWSSDSDLEMLDMLSEWSDLSSDVDNLNTITQLNNRIHYSPNLDSDEVLDDVSSYCNEEDASYLVKDSSSKDGDTYFDRFRCNVCHSAISEYRYTCVQCSEFDLCGACEVSGAHRHHYVLRVPEPRPFPEIQFVLATIRRHLMKKQDPITEPRHDEDIISVKSEIKDEVDVDDCDNNGDVEDNGDDDDNGYGGDDDNGDNVDNSDDDDDNGDEEDDDTHDDNNGVDKYDDVGDNSDERETNDGEEAETKSCDIILSAITLPGIEELENAECTTELSIKEEQESDSSEEEHNGSTDEQQTAPSIAKRKILINRSNDSDVKEDNPSAKKIRVEPLPNTTPRGLEEEVTRVVASKPLMRSHRSHSEN